MRVLVLCCIILGVISFRLENRPSVMAVDVDPQQCIEEKCPSQWAACQKDSKCPQVLQDCQKKCGSDQGCWKTCLMQKGDKPAIDVAKCAAANHCLGEPESKEHWKPKKRQEMDIPFFNVDPQECIEKNCPGQWAACQKDSKCPQVLQDCQKKCGSDQGCWKTCLMQKGDKPAIDVAKCAAAHHCLGGKDFSDKAEELIKGILNMVIEEVEEEIEEVVEEVEEVADPAHCIHDHCPDQMKACQGDQTCFAVLSECGKACQKDQDCMQKCVNGKGDQPAIDLVKCAVDNHCFDQ